MKNIFTILLTIIITSAMAQKKEQLHLLEEFSDSLHPHVLASSYDKQAESGARFMTERLTGFRSDDYTNGNWEGSDSVKYTYLGTNGIATQPHSTCDNLINYDFVANVLTFYSRRTNTFDANNRLTSNIEEMWNGIVWENSFKYVYTYTANGQYETFIQQKWLGSWTNQFKTELTYNGAGERLTETTLSWTNNAWLYMSREIYTFNANNFETSYASEDWVNNAWELSYKYTTSYNANQDIEEQLYQEDLGAGLENVRKGNYSYSANFKNTEFIQQTWVLSALWLNQNKTEYTYTPNGEISASASSDWDSNLNSWNKKTRYTYTYDANNNTTSFMHEKGTNNAWVNFSLNNYTYNAANQRTYLKSATWVNNAWVNKSQDFYTLDANGNALIEQRDSWVNNAWQGLSKYIYTRTIYGNVSTMLYQNWQNGAFTSTSRSFYYYENFDNGLSSVNETKFSATKLFPNPTNSFASVEFEATNQELVTVNLFNVMGALVTTQSEQSNVGANRFVLNTQTFAKGLYTVQIKSANAESNLKLMVN